MLGQDLGWTPTLTLIKCPRVSLPGKQTSPEVMIDPPNLTFISLLTCPHKGWINDWRRP